MSESWPLFQSSLSSTPFSGTMAETSTATPAGELPQTPVANEMPGASGDRARAEKLKSSAALDTAIQTSSELLKHLNDMKWSKHPKSARWVRRQRLGLNGNKDTEPPEMMYRRFQAMSEVGRNLQTLLEEKRLLESPSPGEAAALDTKGREQEKAAAAAIERERRTATVSEIEKLQGHPMDPNVRAQFIEGGYGLDKAAGEQDPIKAATAAAELGAKAGDVSGDPTIPAPMRSFVGAGAKQGARVRAEKKSDDAAADATPVLGMFKNPGQLNTAMHQDFKDLLNTDGYFHMEKYETGDTLRPEGERRAWSKDEIKNARAAVATRYPGYEKYFPNFVEKGFTDAPVDIPAADQKDVTVQQKRAALKAKLAQAK
jgi:hypothetical protein